LVQESLLGNQSSAKPLMLQTACRHAMEEQIIMRQTFRLAVVLLPIGLTLLLGACHATAGAGQDISATGHAITNSADRHTP
jgi:predicted small secreted protein